MAKTILCPYCFESFKNTEVMVQCENYTTRTIDGIPKDVCQREENKRFNNHWDSMVMSKHVFYPHIGLKDKLMGYKPRACECDQCGAPSTRFVCPHCNNWLPTEMIEKGSEIISVIGGPASGKSNYIVALIQQLQKYGYKLQLGQILPQLVGRTKAEYTRNLYEKAKDSIFKDHQPVAKTAVTSHPIPWIFRLESHATKKAVYLVFYDTAGESFKDPEEIKKNAKYLEKSKAVIVLLDTLSLPYIQKILAAKKIVNPDKATPFGETMDALKNFATENPQLLKTPFAFVMSKFDSVIQNQEDLDFDIEPFKHNSSFIQTGTLSLSEVDEASKTIQNYMENHWDEGALGYDITQKWGDNARFFGVSALGAMTNDKMKIGIPDDEQVKPFRVMDPLIWLLHKVGGFGIPVQ